MRRILRNLLTVQLLLFLFRCHGSGVSPVLAHDSDGSLEPTTSDDASENRPRFVDLKDMGDAEDAEDSDSPRRFKTAEMADAVMGSEAAFDPSDIESLVPRNVKEFPAGFSLSCDVGSTQCVSPEEDTSQQVSLDIVRSEEKNITETKTYKVSCERRNVTGVEKFTVQVINASQDLMDFLNANGTECSVVLFFTTWCQFSASLAPHFNALPRVFPSMHFLALDAAQHSSLSTRFGTVAVPNILLFQGAKPMARFNHTERTLETLTSFIANQTGFDVGPDVNVTDADWVGPLASVPVRSIDWLLVFSVLFITGFSAYAVLRTDSIRWLIPGQEHEHQD